jgi:hypothetical protein
MAKSYYSTVFDHPADRVWPVVRDFGNYKSRTSGHDILRHRSLNWLLVSAPPRGQLTRTRSIASFTTLRMREASDCGWSGPT